MKILLKIAYDGAEYCGWQVQKNALSVQGALCDAARNVYGDDVKVTGCSRTDSGVHAREYFCTLEIPNNSADIPCERIPGALNRYLAQSITVFSAEKVMDEFHPRYCAKQKTYRYVFDNGEQRDPFMADRAWHIPKKLNEIEMDRAAKEFIGKYDFEAFMASGSSVEDTVRQIFDASVKRQGDLVIFEVTGNGFLYNMVRIMAGTLYYVSIGKLCVEDINKIILQKDRRLAGITAPAHGLYLWSVTY